MANKKVLIGKFYEGQEVFYRDVDQGADSGSYRIKEQLTEDKDGYAVYCITNEFNTIDVYEYELSIRE